MKNFLKKLLRVKFGDIPHMFMFVLAIIPSKMKKKENIWLICEDEMEARDNGYWLFKFIKENYPEQSCYYAINKKSSDYKKVSHFGDIIEYGSFKHWIYYLAASRNISSQKSGKPNAAICYFLEVYGLINANTVFLQHGIIKDDLKWLYYSVTKMKMFCTSAFDEYKYVKEKFGYPENAVKYVGQCRFDNLHNINSDLKTILIMPTWREWIADEDYRLKKLEGTTVISETDYFKKWNEFLNNEQLVNISKKYNIKFMFFPHRNMQKYLKYFCKSNEFIEIIDWRDRDIQDVLKEAALMITDYSSVFFDMIYMKKPIIFYQFDYEKFRSYQYSEGYFNYKDNPFGKSFCNQNDVFNELEKIINNDFKVSSDYLTAHDNFYRLYDCENCKRTYNEIKNLYRH